MRKLWLTLLVLALLLFGAFSPLLFPLPSRVTRAAFDRIEVGMSLAEAEAILGGPAGDYTTEPPAELAAVTTGVILVESEKSGEWLHVWAGDEGIVDLGIDRAGCVVGKEFTEKRRSKVGLVPLLRWRFNRWRGRGFSFSYQGNMKRAW